MNIYNFIFSRDGGGNIAANLCVREDGFVRTAGGNEMDPSVVQVGDSIRVSPNPRAVQVVSEIVIEVET